MRIRRPSAPALSLILLAVSSPIVVVVLSSCRLGGVTAAEAVRIAANDVADLEHWRIEDVRSVSAALLSDVRHEPHDSAPPDQPVWVVRFSGTFPGACGSGRCDFTFTEARITVDATNGEVLIRELDDPIE